MNNGVGPSKWRLAGSLDEKSMPPGRACARQATLRLANAGSRNLWLGVELKNNLVVRSSLRLSLLPCMYLEQDVMRRGDDSMLDGSLAAVQCVGIRSKQPLGAEMACLYLFTGRTAGLDSWCVL